MTESPRFSVVGPPLPVDIKQIAQWRREIEALLQAAFAAGKPCA